MQLEICRKSKPGGRVNWTSEQFLSHPVTGDTAYGHVPELKIHRGPTFPAGAIHLKYGEHRGPHRGFGFQHIWREHYSGIANHDDAMEAIRKHLAEALQPRAPIFFDSDSGDRLEVYRFKSNSVLIEWRNGIYSVVTAGFIRKITKGSRVGALISVEPVTPKQPS